MPLETRCHSYGYNRHNSADETILIVMPMAKSYIQSIRYELFLKFFIEIWNRLALFWPVAFICVRLENTQKSTLRLRAQCERDIA